MHLVSIHFHYVSIEAEWDGIGGSSYWLRDRNVEGREEKGDKMADTRAKVEKKGRKEKAVNSEGAWWRECRKNKQTNK